MHAVSVVAIETPADANLVDALRKEAYPVVSLVAEDNGAIVGHIMFSPVSLPGLAGCWSPGISPSNIPAETICGGVVRLFRLEDPASYRCPFRTPRPGCAPSPSPPLRPSPVPFRSPSPEPPTLSPVLFA